MITSNFKMAVLVMAVIANLLSCSKNGEDKSIFVNIPDNAFKAVLVSNTAINTNGNSEIEITEAEAYTGAIVASSLKIADVTGIEHFINIISINVLDNALSTIDVSKNTKVTQLLVESNKLTSLDVSALSVLTDLKAHENLLQSANIANGNNSNMTRMQLQDNPDLGCIKVDALTVPDSGWIKGSGNYSLDCN